MKANKVILPIISALAITGCSHFQTATRGELLNRLNETQEGVQPDESVIACSRSISIKVARTLAEEKVRKLLENHTIETVTETDFQNEYACDAGKDGAICCVKANKNDL